MKLKNILSILLLTAFISFPALAMQEMMDRHGDAGMMDRAPMNNHMEKMHKGKKMSFEDMKAKKLERIEKHIAKLQEKKSCIQSASDKEALRECKKKYKMYKKEKKGHYMKDKMQ